MSKNTDVQAFPRYYETGRGHVVQSEGMTLRDYFAAQALSGLIVGRSMFPQEWAEAAYELADAMLKARES